MTEHRLVIEVGPAVVRRLCCDTGIAADSELATAALDAIDDQVTLVDELPVPVDSLWRRVLASVACERYGELTVVYPSWWSSSRIAVVTDAARSLTNHVVALSRSVLLRQADPGPESDTTVVEVAHRLVAIASGSTDGQLVAVPRRADIQATVDEIAAVVAGEAGTVVVIDGPSTVQGGPEFAASIAEAVTGIGGTVIATDDARPVRLVQKAAAEPDRPGVAAVRVARRPAWPAAAGVLLVTAVPIFVLAEVLPGRHGAVSAVTAPTTSLVEGQVALTVPANWPTQRVIAGPGSARVQVTSPSDPEVALHFTQSPVPGETLSGTAERLRRAIDAEPAGVFVDFNPADTRAGRPAVTYREVRGAHEVKWTVLLDGAMRISIGCQSRSGDEDAVRLVCDQAIRSAHKVG